MSSVYPEAQSPKGGYPEQAPFVTDLLAPPPYSGPAGFMLNLDATKGSAANYHIAGTDSQVVQITLQPGEACGSEPGAMLYKADSIKMTTSMGGCCGAIKRSCGGESLFQNKYTNKGAAPATVSFSPDYPSKIVPVDLSRSGTLYAHPGAYLCHTGEVKISAHLVRNLGAACFGGAGLIVQKLSGSGTVFINGGGAIMEKVLAAGEKVAIDTHSLLAFTASSQYGVKSTGGCVTCCCGGEGLFNTTLTGPGTVLVNSMSLHRMRYTFGYYDDQGRPQKKKSGAGGALSMAANIIG